MIIVVFASFITTQGQTTTPSDDKILQSLLNEVRLLRETLQRANSNNYQVQILIERIKLQNDRVTRITRSLEDIRTQMADLQANINSMSDRANAAASQIESESNLTRKRELELEQKEYKNVITHQKTRSEQLQTREPQLSVDLLNEQQKLIDLEVQLENLFRKIEDEIKKPSVTGK